jgi:hypothetical protein
VALLGPAAIAIHDDGNVLGQDGRGLCGHEPFIYKFGAGTLPPITQKRSLRLSTGNDKFESLNFDKVCLGQAVYTQIIQRSH